MLYNNLISQVCVVFVLQVKPNALSFDNADLKSILISVAGSVVFALLVYVVRDYWKEKKAKREQNANRVREENAAQALQHEEMDMIRMELSEVDKLSQNGMFEKAINKCQSLLSQKNIHRYPGLHWSAKLKAGDIYFELRTHGNFEQNCLHALDSRLSALEICKKFNDPEAEALTEFNIGVSFAALSAVRSKESNLDKAIQYLQNSIEKFEASASPSVMVFEVNRALSQVYRDYSTIREKEKYMTLAVEFYKKSVKEVYPYEGDKYIVNVALAHMLLELSNVKDKEANLLEAISLFREAEENVSVEEQPDFLAEIRTNMAVAFGSLYTANKETAHLNAAIFYTEEALKVYKADDYPYYHATNQANLGALLIEQLVASQDIPAEAQLQTAFDPLLKAQEFFTLASYPLDHADLMMSFAESYGALAKKINKTENLNKAISFMESAKRIYGKRYPDRFQKCSDDILEFEKALSSS